MENVLNILQTKEDLLHGKGVQEEAVKLAEAELGIKFAEDYKIYLLEYAIVAYDGHEITGISNAQRTHVVNVTKNERDYNPNIYDGCYVIEQAGIDDIVIWQNAEGIIYKTVGKSQPIEICKSLSEYFASY